MKKTTAKTKLLEKPTYAIFLKSWWLTHSKYDDRYLTLVILFTPVTLVTLITLLWPYNQFCRAECITVSGFSYEKWNERQREIQIYIFSARHQGGREKGSISFSGKVQPLSCYAIRRNNLFAETAQLFVDSMPMDIGQSCHSFMQIRWQQSECKKFKD